MSQTYTDNCFTTTGVVQTQMGQVEENFAALKSAFSGATTPANTVAGMWWFDTTANILKLRNEANSAWLSVWDFANNKPIVTNNISADFGAALKDTAAGTAGLRTLGTTAVKACAGNDARLSDARSPTNNSVSVAQLVAPTAGTVIIGRHDVVATTLSETYVLMKMFTVLQTGTFRTSFAIRGINPATTAYGRIYKNGAAFGTERSKRDNTYQTFTEDLAFNVGDTCEMWLKNSNDGAYVQSFRMSVATVCIGVARGA